MCQFSNSDLEIKAIFLKKSYILQSCKTFEIQHNEQRNLYNSDCTQKFVFLCIAWKKNHHSACSSLSFWYALLQSVRLCKNKENLSFALSFAEETLPCVGSLFHVQITTAEASKYLKQSIVRG